jgi:ribonuclease P protein component
VFAFTKKQRLLNKIDYDCVFERAKKLTTSEFIVLYRDNNLGYARLGLAISKKKIAKAHERNRVKRLLRESFRHQRLPAVDVIFLAKRNTTEQTNVAINNQLSQTWGQINSCYAK